MLIICLTFSKFQPVYAYKGYAYKKKSVMYFKKILKMLTFGEIIFFYFSCKFALYYFSGRGKTCVKMLILVSYV